jgi:membrane-associated HD superfamily phosphohydrolase
MSITDYLSGIDRYTSGEKQDVTTAATNLANLQTGAGSLPSQLKEALNKKLNYNKDIINQQSDVMQQYFAAPSAARAKYQDVWNPFEREKLVAQERTMALKPYDTLSGVLDQRMGDVADITTAGVQGWQGMVDAASTQLNAATTRLGTALQAYQIAGGQQSAADELALSVAQFNEANRQFNATMEMNKDQFGQQMDLEKLKLAKSGSGGLTSGEKASKATNEAWDEALSMGMNEDGTINEWKVWNHINQKQGIWAKQGVDVQALWNSHSALKRQYPGATSATTTTPVKNNWSGNQMDLTTGRIPYQPAASTSLKPGDPGYINGSDLLKSYLLFKSQ